MEDQANKGGADAGIVCHGLLHFLPHLVLDFVVVVAPGNRLPGEEGEQHEHSSDGGVELRHVLLLPEWFEVASESEVVLCVWNEACSREVFIDTLPNVAEGVSSLIGSHADNVSSGKLGIRCLSIISIRIYIYIRAACLFLSDLVVCMIIGSTSFAFGLLDS